MEEGKFGRQWWRWQMVLLIGGLVGGVWLLTLIISSPNQQADLKPTTQLPIVMLASSPTATFAWPTSTTQRILFPSTTPHATTRSQLSSPRPINQLGALATLDPELIRPEPINLNALANTLATPNFLTTAIPRPTVTALAEFGLERHIYLINSLEDPKQFQLQRADPTGLVPIARVDGYSARFMAILPAQHTLLIPRNLQLIAIDDVSKRERWSYQLLPKMPNEFNGMIALDQTKTGVYLLEQNGQQGWRWSYRALADGRALAPTKQLQFQADSAPLLTAAGQIWLLNQRELVRLDVATEHQTSFGLSFNQLIIGDGQQTELGIFRSNQQLGLINWATGAERIIRLNQPIIGEVFNGALSHDQTMLLVDSGVLEPETDVGQSKIDHSIYRLTDGELQIREQRIWPTLIVPASTADQWLVVTKNPLPKLIIEHQLGIDRWNSSTDTIDDRYHFSTAITRPEIIWVGEVVGSPIQPLDPEFHTAVTPLPTMIPLAGQLSTPAPAPPHTKPIVLLKEWPKLNPTSWLYQVRGDQQSINVAKIVVKLLPRLNQPPLVLSRPHIMTWQLYDPATEQRVEWQFDQMILLDHLPRFNPLLAANGEQMVAIVQQDLDRTDIFTAEYQLVVVNTKTGEWKVLSDSANWPALPNLHPLAWQGQTLYFQQVDQAQQRQWLWQVQLGTEFRPEILLEIPLTLATAFTDKPDAAPVLVSPNQRWLLYTEVNAQNGMTVHILDLVQHQRHTLQLPLESSRLSSQYWFSPAGNHLALTIRDYATNTDYLALYDFEQQQLYQLDYAQHFGFAQPFLWSPDGHWLAVLFNDFSAHEQVYLFDVEQAQLVAQTKLDPLWEPIALMNDGQTILTRFYNRNTIQQMQLIDSEWQVIWRLPIESKSDIVYVYPR